MGIFRELHVLLTLCKCCSLVPYVPPRSARRGGLRAINRSFYLRIVLALAIILLITWLRTKILNEYSLFLNRLSYVIWLLGATVDTLVLSLLLVANGLNVAQYDKLIVLLSRIETAVDGWTRTARVRHGTGYPPYRWFIALSLILCAAFYVYGFFGNFKPDVHLALQIRWEVLIVDIYLLHVFLVLVAMGRCAKRLRMMCRDAIERCNIGDFCAVLRLRDDLLCCVELVNRMHGVLFLGISASWLVSMTCIVYFDFIYSGLQLTPDQPFLLEHALLLLWKSVLAGTLLTVAGCVAERIKEVACVTRYSGMDSARNRLLAEMLDKLHIKCQFQDIRFTVYGLFTIDNSLTYMVVSSTVTYLVIVTQFRQLEIEAENKRME